MGPAAARSCRWADGRAAGRPGGGGEYGRGAGERPVPLPSSSSALPVSSAARSAKGSPPPPHTPILRNSGLFRQRCVGGRGCAEPLPVSALGQNR